MIGVNVCHYGRQENAWTKRPQTVLFGLQVKYCINNKDVALLLNANKSLPINTTHREELAQFYMKLWRLIMSTSAVLYIEESMGTIMQIVREFSHFVTYSDSPCAPLHQYVRVGRIEYRVITIPCMQVQLTMLLSATATAAAAAAVYASSNAIPYRCIITCRTRSSLYQPV